MANKTNKVNPGQSPAERFARKMNRAAIEDRAKHDPGYRQKVQEWKRIRTDYGSHTNKKEVDMAIENGIQVGIIQRTKDYGVFKKLLGNRDVTEARINRILDSVKKNGYIFSPICVNEKMEVIDGQGRLEAFKKLGIPVDYYITRGVGLKECVAMNNYQTKWSNRDFIRSYASGGNKSYIRLEELLDSFPEIPDGTIIYAVSHVDVSSKRKSIQGGTFDYEKADFDRARKVLNYVKKFVPIIKKVGGRAEAYYTGAIFCYEHPDVENVRLLNKVDRYRAELVPAIKNSQAVDALEDVYNYHSKEKSYFATDYQKMLDGKYAWYRNKYMKDEDGAE